VLWTRRRFIKFAGLTGSAALASSSCSDLKKILSQSGVGSNTQIAIVGGGIAGLNAAYHLKQAGLKAIVYEGKPQLGGRIRSVVDAVGKGLVVDLGGAFINSDHQDILNLVKALDLKTFNRTQDAQRLPFPETGYILGGKFRSEAEVAEKLRPLALQIAQDAKRLEQDAKGVGAVLDRLSIAQYLNQHAQLISEPLIRVLIENSVRTEYGVEPEESSALQLLFTLPTVDGKQVEILSNSDEALVVEGGSGKIIERLAAALPGQIQTRMPLTHLQARAQDFLLTFNDRQAIAADVVILAIPFTVLREIKLQVTLPDQLRRFIQEVDLGFNEKVFAGFSQKAWRQANGFVTEAWTDLGFSEVWDETQRQADRQDGALTFYLGGHEVKSTQGLTAKALGAQLSDRLHTSIPGLKQAANQHFLQTQWAGDRFVRGAYTNFKPGQYTAFSDFLYVESDKPEERQDVAVGNLIFAGEHLSDSFYGFMNGAAQTGRLAAEVVIRQVKM
jgi:monoamine oxidase